MDRIVIREGDRVRVLKSAGYASEQELQDFLLRFPALIPLEEAEEDPLPFLPIGREVTLGSGSADVLFLDAAGLLTLVETKLRRNPEARRTVVGQTLEYGASLSKLSAEDVVSRANAYLRSGHAAEEYRALTLPEAMTKLLETSATEAGRELLPLSDLEARIGEQLRNGRIRLIVAVDDIYDELRKTVTFVNTHSSFDIYLLQLVRFKDDEDGRDIFVPHLFGYARKSHSLPPVLDEEKFREKLRDLRDEEAAQIVEELLRFTAERDAIGWGRTGAAEASFSFYCVFDGRRISIFTVTSGGHLWVNFAWMKNKIPAQHIDQFRQDLNRIPGVAFDESVVSDDKRPPIRLRLLSGDGLALFKQAVASLGDAIGWGEALG